MLAWFGLKVTRPCSSMWDLVFSPIPKVKSAVSSSRRKSMAIVLPHKTSTLAPEELALTGTVMMTIVVSRKRRIPFRNQV